MTIDHHVAARLKGRSPAWRLGAATTAAIGIVLTAWSLSTDFVEASNNGFFGDAATYYMLGHSLADDLDFEYQREDLVLDLVVLRNLHHGWSFRTVRTKWSTSMTVSALA